MQPRLLPILFAAAALFATPAANAQSKAPATDSTPVFALSAGSFSAGNFLPWETRHPGVAPPRGTELRWGMLGPDRDGGVRFGARLSGPAGTWTLDHTDGHWRGATAHRFRLGYAKRF